MDIVEELRQNRESGARRLESEYKAGLMTLAMRFCDSPSDAEELVNRTFAAVVAGIDDYLEQSAFFAWMCQILKNIHSLDKRRKSNQYEVYLGEVPDVVDEDAQEEIYRSLDRSLVRDAIGTLEEADKELLILHYFLDIPLWKMAKILAVPVGTVKSRLHYARNALAAKLGVAAKKPGGKAVLLALLLCGLTALGAAITAAVNQPSNLQPSTSQPSNLQPAASSNLPQSPSRVAGSPQRGAEGGSAFSQGENMNATATTNTAAMLASASLAIAAAQSASAQNVLAYWDFSSDPQGEFDRAGFNDLSNAGGVPITDGAAVFDGTAKALFTRHAIAFQQNKAYTIECFALAEADCDGMIMEVSPDNNAVLGGFYLYAKEGVMARTSTRGYNGERFKNGTICDGQWHHLAVIVDPSTNVVTDIVRLYVDGERQGVRSQNGANVLLNQYRFYFGSRNGTALPFKGRIDDVRITEGVLSTDQFMQARSSGTIDVRAYWMFDSASPLADASGNSNTILGDTGVTFANGCASFDGTASNVRTSDTLDLGDTKDVTVECFIRKHAGADTIAMVLEHSANYYSNVQGFYLTLNETRTGAVQGNFRFSDSYRFGISPTYCLNAGWHHVALVKNSARVGQADCISLYVDGIRLKEYSGSTASDAFMRNDYLYLGSRNNAEYFLDADIDDVRITAQALVPGQFLRTRTGPREDTIAYWPFKAGKLLEDASGNGNTLTGSGVTVSTDYSAVFNGSQSNFATIAPLPLYPYDSVTIEFFMKSSMASTGIILETSSNYGDHSGAFGIFAKDTAGFRTSSSFNVLDNGWAALDGAWHHYALILDWDCATSDVVRLYRDGVQHTTHGASGTYNKTDIANLLSDVLYIGARGGSTLPFVGELDDIRITGRALDPTEFLESRSVPEGLTIVIR